MTSQQNTHHHGRLGRRQVKILASIALVLIASGGFWWYYSILEGKRQAALIAAQKASLQDFFLGFSENGLIPIIRPGSHVVGSVYNAATGRWVDEASTCFPDLKVGAAEPGVLPNVSVRDLQQGTAALGLGKLLSATANAKSVRSIHITFSDVSVQVVPERALRDAFSPQNCSDLKSIFESVISGEAPTPPSPAYLIIQAVYSAKRKLVVQMQAENDAKEALEDAKSLPVKGSIEAKGGGSFDLVLENEQSIPVAASPAFIPTTIGVMLSGDQKSSPETVWLPFRPESDPEATRVFKALVGPAIGN
jgi:hypothetical protein